jgi:hypothetical protein
MANLGKGYIIQMAVTNPLSSRQFSKTLNLWTHKPTLLLVVLYGCKTWSLSLRVENKLQMSENKVFRKMFGPKKDGKVL